MQETATGTTKVLHFKPATKPNNRLWVAQQGKFVRGIEGVTSAQVGELSIIRPSVNSNIIDDEVLEITYDVQMAREANQKIDEPITVTKAYINKEDGLICAEFVNTIDDGCDPQDTAFHVWMGQPTFTIGDKTYDRNEIKSLVYRVNAGSGTQVRNARTIAQAQEKERVARQEHETRVAKAYAERDLSGWQDYRVREAIDNAEARGVFWEMTSDQRRAHKDKREQVARELAGMYYAELWAVVKVSLGKLRCEVNFIDNSADPYGFVTPSEVALYILYRWADDYSDRDLRTYFAKQFVDNYLR